MPVISNCFSSNNLWYVYFSPYLWTLDKRHFFVLQRNAAENQRLLQIDRNKNASKVNIFLQIWPVLILRGMAFTGMLRANANLWGIFINRLRVFRPSDNQYFYRQSTKTVNETISERSLLNQNQLDKRY